MSVEKTPTRTAIDCDPVGRVVSNLAAQFLRDSIMAGNPAEIPSLGLTLIKGEDGKIHLIDTPSILPIRDTQVYNTAPSAPALNRRERFFTRIRSFLRR